MERSMDHLREQYQDKIAEFAAALERDPSYAIDIATEARKIIKRKSQRSEN